MALRGITLVLNAAQLSDLFFNFDHPARSALYAKDDFEPQEADAADLLDAKEFAGILGIEHEDFIADLVKDFQQRL